MAQRREFILEGIETMDQFYDQISEKLGLMDWFGRNLDALNDAFRGGCGSVDPKGTTFIWRGWQESQRSLSRFDTIVEIFQIHDVGGREAADDVKLVLE